MARALATGGSNDTIFAGSGSATIFGAFGGTIGNDVIFGGAGILEVVTGGSNDTVFGGTSAGQTVFGGFDAVAANNGNSVIFSGPNAMVIDAAGSSDTIHAGTGNDTLWFRTGTLAGDKNLVFGGSGNLRAQFVGGAGSATIIGGAGSSTVFGLAGSNVNFQGSEGNVTMIALGPVDAAGETLNAGGSSTDNMLEAVSGSISMVGGSGNDTLVGGVTDNSSVAGATTITGGAGDNLFFFQHGNVNGTDIVTDFTAGAGNLMVMSGYDALVGGGPQSAANAALAGATSSGGNTNITLADGTKITFDNTTVAQLQGHIFSS